MKKVTWLISGLAVVLLSCPATFAKEAKAPGDKAEARKAKKEKGAEAGGLRGEYAIMASVLKLDEAQKAKLQGAIEANQAAHQEWLNTDGGKKFAETTKAAAEARKAGDKAKAKELAGELKALQADREKLEAANKARIEAVLTPEQKTQWAAFSVERRAMMRYKKLNLTEEQTKQIKDLSAEAAKTWPDASDRKAVGAAGKKLNADIEQKVLTDAQRQELAKSPEAKQPRGDRPAKEPKVRGKAGKAAE